MFSMLPHSLIMNESWIIQILGLSSIKINFNLSLLEILICFWIEIFRPSFKSSKYILSVEVMKTPNNKDWTSRPDQSNYDSLPNTVYIIRTLGNVWEKQRLSPKYEYTNTSGQSVKWDSWLEKVYIIFLSMPPRA